MSDNNQAPDIDASTETNTTLAVNSTYKILGELTTSDGVGVLGQNNASSGTPIGVQGAVPNSSGGYGLATADDVRIGGAVDTDGTDFVVEVGSDSSGDARNVISGHADNTVVSGVSGATIAGGGKGSSVSSENKVFDNFGTVSGGYSNEAGDDDGDTQNGWLATVSGGGNNVARAFTATVCGGEYNEVTQGSTAGAVGGGSNNSVTAGHGTIAGGESNTAGGQYSTAGGGRNADATGFASTVAGGSETKASATYTSVSGGFGNSATARSATVGGGEDNTASGDGSTVPGGDNNTASGTDSFAAGTYAEAADDGAFVWADTTTDDKLAPVQFSSSSGPGPTGADTFSARATGGVRFATGTNSDGSVSTGVQVGAGSGSWSSLSARTAKSDIRPVDTTTVLERVRSLDVCRWRYDTEKGAEHMGPMAEEFTESFRLGASDRHITNVDADGVALAAIQGLADRTESAHERLEAENEKLRTRVAEKEDRIEAVESENEALRDRLSTLEDRLATVESRLEEN